jgi:hypothetical protein
MQDASRITKLLLPPPAGGVSDYQLFAMLAKHLTTQCEPYTCSSTASILANGAINTYLDVFSAESSQTNCLSRSRPGHVAGLLDETDRSFFYDSHLRTQQQRAHTWKFRSGTLRQKLGVFCLKTVPSPWPPHMDSLPSLSNVFSRKWSLLAVQPRRPCPLGSLARAPNCSSWRVFGPARSVGPPGASLAPGPPPCGGTGCHGPTKWAFQGERRRGFGLITPCTQVPAEPPPACIGSQVYCFFLTPQRFFKTLFKTSTYVVR